MRAHYKTHDDGRVTITFRYPHTGDRVSRTFYCPLLGGDVWDVTNARRHCVVGERLQLGQNIIASPSRAHLKATISTAYINMIRAERRRVRALHTHTRD